MIFDIAAHTAAPQQATISGAGVGLSLGGVALLGGIAIGMHHRHKSPRIIGWICFCCGIALAFLLTTPIAGLSQLSLWNIPVVTVLTGYVAFVFFHDGLKRRGGGSRLPAVRGAPSSGGGGGGAHRWLQPIFGLILPALLLTLGGSIGNGIHQGLAQINHTVGSTVSNTTGK